MRKPSIYMNDIFLNNLWPEFCLFNSKNQKTLSEYFSYICLFCDYIKKDFLDANLDDILDYCSYMQLRAKENTFSIRTILVRLSCYRTFEKFMVEKHPEFEITCNWNKIERPAVDSSITATHIPSLENLDLILSSAKVYNSMWYIILSLVIKCALSASEIINLTFDSIIEEKGSIYLSFFKPSFKEKRYVKLPEDVQLLLTNYLESLLTQDSKGHVFYNNRGNAVTQKNLDDNIAKIINMTGITQHYSIKDIRSRAVLELIAASSDPAGVAEYVGLSDLRIRSFVDASGLVTKAKSPADLLNFSINPL